MRSELGGVNRALVRSQEIPRPFHSRPRNSWLHRPVSVLMPRNGILGVTPGSSLFSPNIGNKVAIEK